MEFQGFPKLQRLTGPVIVTEKIDGTNACIIIENGIIGAQSRTKIITPDKDNFGFARWVYDNAKELIELLGEGRHFGEWWGAGIQRGYGLKNKYFSLFNTERWDEELFDKTALNIRVVPKLFEGTFVEVINEIPRIMNNLQKYGSVAAPNFTSPEGIVLYDTRSGQGYKKTFDYDDSGKGLPKDEHGNALKGN